MAEQNKKKYVVDFPALIAEWDWEKNEKMSLYPDWVSHGSAQKVWWKCKKCGYEWETSPNNRTNINGIKNGCPCCANKKTVKGINDLQTRFPEIAKRWHPTKNSKKACEVTPFCNDNAWWVCEKDDRHIFKAKIYHVTSGKTVCPVCSNQTIIVGVNDFQTTSPELLKEWHWERNNEAGVFPTQVTKGVNKKVWWKCAVCGHEWKATIGSRAGEQRCGCPECKKDLSSSFPEKAISFYLAKFFCVEENKKFSWLGNSEIDIYVDQLKLGVEYDGKIWHTNVEKDLKKDELCKAQGITIVRVREKACPTYISTSHKIIREGMRDADMNKCIQNLFAFISDTFNMAMDVSVDINADYAEILAKIHTGKKAKSVASTELISSWNFDKNGNLLPENIGINSHYKVWWVCAKGHEWQAAVYSRTGKEKCGCPYCAGQKVWKGDNDLETLYPSIAKEWDFETNTKLPSQVRPKDNKKYWWICSVCQNRYQSSPAHRIGEGKGCPACGRAKTAASHCKKVMNLDTGKTFESIQEAGNAYSVRPSAISNCCRGVCKTAGGYHWKFAEE